MKQQHGNAERIHARSGRTEGVEIVPVTYAHKEKHKRIEPKTDFVQRKTFQTVPDWWRYVRQLNKDARETCYLPV